MRAHFGTFMANAWGRSCLAHCARRSGTPRSIRPKQGARVPPARRLLTDTLDRGPEVARAGSLVPTFPATSQLGSHLSECRLMALLAVPQRLLHLLPLGDVRVRPGHAVDARGVAKRHPAVEDPAVRPVLVPEAVFRLIFCRPAVDAGAQRRQRAVVVFRVQPLLPLLELVRDFVVLVADHALPAGRVVTLPGRAVPVPKPVPRATDRQLKTLLTSAQQLL